MLKDIVGTHVYRLGDDDPAVHSIQQRLRAIGYPLTATGIHFGPATLAAVQDFQRRAHLIADGDVGRLTAVALDVHTTPRTPSSPPIIALAVVSRPLWLTVSLSHNGLREAAGAADNPELVHDIQEVAKDYFHDSTPWCAGWVSFCLLHASCKPSSSPLWALSYADGWGLRLPGPALGAIAVKHRAGGGHVTIVAGRTASGRLACSGGNQNDQVSVAGYPEDVFDGFYWPLEVAPPSETRFSALPIINASGAPIHEA